MCIRDRRDTVLLNAGASIYAGRRADTIAQGIEMAREAIDSGAALKKLEQVIEMSNSIG